MRGNMRRYSREFFTLTMLFMVTVFVFWRVLEADFLVWDDDTNIYKNAHIQSLDGAHLSWMFGDFAHALRYKPLSWLTWAIIYHFSALDAFGYHLVNLLFHAANVMLAFLLLRKLASLCVPQPAKTELSNYTLSCAAAGAMLWGLHPMRVEPVAWATGLPYEQSLFFMLISLLCYLYAEAPGELLRNSRRLYVGSVIAFLLALATYPIVFGYGIVLVALDVFVLKRFERDGKNAWFDAAGRRVWLEKLPFFFFTGLLVAATVYGRIFKVGDWPEAMPLSEFGLLARMMQAFYVWAYYVWRPWWPVNLSPIYTTLIWNKPLDVPFVLSLLGVAGLSLFLFIRRKRYPLLLAIWLCHLGLLVPMLGLTERPHYTHDRYSIIVSLCWAVTITIGLLKWKMDTFARQAALVVVTGLIGVLGFMSFNQTHIWRDNIVFFQDMISKLGNNEYRTIASLQLGNSYLAVGDAEKAIDAYKAALGMDPKFVKAHYNLANTFVTLGRFNEAIAEYETTLKLDPKHLGALNNYSLALIQQNRFAEAIPQLQEALKLDANNSDTHLNLGTALAKTGKLNEAASELSRALQLDAGNAEAHQQLGELLMKQGKTDEARGHLQEAARLQAGKPKNGS